LYSFDYFVYCCSVFNKLAGWHSDEHWSDLILIITCSFTDILKFMYSRMHLVLRGCHINVHVIVILIMIDQRKKNLLELCWMCPGNLLEIF